MSIVYRRPSMDDNNFHKLRITSYNCRGFNETKIPYMTTLLSHCEFLFLQEHWLADCQLHKLNNICHTHTSHGLSGFDHEEFISGRPYGGCAIFSRADIGAQVHFVPTCNRRICSIRVCGTTYKLLLINVYMPYESDADAAEEFSSVLADVVALIDQFNDHCFVLGGDFNVDFDKHQIHSKLLLNACNDNNVRFATLHDVCTIDYTYNFNLNRFSFIDHFAVSAAVFESSIDSCTVRHDGDNLSDHDPITLSFTIDWTSVDTSSRQHVPKCNWRKASPSDLTLYKCHLKVALDALYLPIDAVTCHNVTCKNTSHYKALNDYSNALIYACIDSANHAIPHTKRHEIDDQADAIPGWNEHVAPFARNRYFGTIFGLNAVVRAMALWPTSCVEVGLLIIMQFVLLRTTDLILSKVVLQQRS